QHGGVRGRRASETGKTHLRLLQGAFFASAPPPGVGSQAGVPSTADRGPGSDSALQESAPGPQKELTLTAAGGGQRRRDQQRRRDRQRQRDQQRRREHGLGLLVSAGLALGAQR